MTASATLGVMAKRKPRSYNDKERMAVADDLALGYSPYWCSRKHGIPFQTVYAWVERPDFKEVLGRKREKIGKRLDRISDAAADRLLDAIVNGEDKHGITAAGIVLTNHARVLAVTEKAEEPEQLDRAELVERFAQALPPDVVAEIAERQKKP